MTGRYIFATSILLAKFSEEINNCYLETSFFDVVPDIFTRILN